MIAGVADTHTALWYLLNNPRLSFTARSFIDNAATAGDSVVISPISLAEIVYLVEKKRLPESAYVELRKALNDPDSVLQEGKFTGDIVGTMRQVPRVDIPDICPIGLSLRRRYITASRPLAATVGSELPPSKRYGSAQLNRRPSK